jgi:hypothetical protein
MCDIRSECRPPTFTAPTSSVSELQLTRLVTQILRFPALHRHNRTLLANPRLHLASPRPPHLQHESEHDPDMHRAACVDRHIWIELFRCEEDQQHAGKSCGCTTDCALFVFGVSIPLNIFRGASRMELIGESIVPSLVLAPNNSRETIFLQSRTWNIESLHHLQELRTRAFYALTLTHPLTGSSSPPPPTSTFRFIVHSRQVLPTVLVVQSAAQQSTGPMSNRGWEGVEVGQVARQVHQVMPSGEEFHECRGRGVKQGESG